MSVHTITKGVGTPRWMAPEVCVHLSLLAGHQGNITAWVSFSIEFSTLYKCHYWHGLTSMNIYRLAYGSTTTTRSGHLSCSRDINFIQSQFYMCLPFLCIGAREQAYLQAMWCLLLWNCGLGVAYTQDSFWRHSHWSRVTQGGSNGQKGQ